MPALQALAPTSILVPSVVDPSGDPALVYLGDGWVGVPGPARGVVAGATSCDAALARVRSSAADPINPLAVSGESTTPAFMAVVTGEIDEVTGAADEYLRRRAWGADVWPEARAATPGLGPGAPATVVRAPVVAGRLA